MAALLEMTVRADDLFHATRPQPYAWRAVLHRQPVDQGDGAVSWTEQAGTSACRVDGYSQSDPGETMANVWTDRRPMKFVEAHLLVAIYDA